VYQPDLSSSLGVNDLEGVDCKSAVGRYFASRNTCDVQILKIFGVNGFSYSEESTFDSHDEITVITSSGTIII
jgi:hypothetical protein